MSGTQGFSAALFWPALGVVSPYLCDAKGPGGAYQADRTSEGGRQGGSRGSTGTYLGPWGSRKPWLAWRSIIPLRREQGRLQSSDVDALAGPAGGQLAAFFCSPQHTCAVLVLVLGSSSLSLPCVPSSPSPGPAQQVCAEGMGGQVEREFILQSTIMPVGQAEQAPAQWVRGGQGQRNI